MRSKYSPFQIDSGFFTQCLHASVIEIHEINGRLDMGNGTALRLRQLERICRALNVGLPVALLLLDFTERVAELEEKVRLLRGPGNPSEAKKHAVERVGRKYRLTARRQQQ